MLDDPDFQFAMVKFFGNADMAKMILMSNKAKGGKGAKNWEDAKKMSKEEIESEHKKRMA
jgi:hypothetical protein